MRVDHGSHRLHPATPPALLADLRALLGADLQTRPRHGRLRVAGRWVGFPLRPAELARALPPRLIGRIGAEALTAPVRRREPPSFAAALRKGLGPDALRAALRAVRREALGPPRRPDLRRPGGQAGHRRHAVEGGRPGAAPGPLRPDRPGPGLPLPAARLRPDRRGAGRRGGRRPAPRSGLGSEVTEVGHGARRGRGAHRGRRGRSRPGTRSRTVPLPLLARLAAPGPPAQVLEDAARLRFRAMVLVYLVHQGGRWTPYDAHYFPGPETPVTRVSRAGQLPASPRRTPTTAPCCAPRSRARSATRCGTASDEDLAGAGGRRRCGSPACRRYVAAPWS